MAREAERVSDRNVVFLLGVVLLFSIVCIIVYLFIFDPHLAAKIVSMITASHIAGRLAFIGVGLEFKFPIPELIGIIIFYNTAYVFVVYSLMMFLWDQTLRIKFVHKYVESTKEKAIKKTKELKKWSWFGVAFYVWVPLPWTGALMGSLIAHIEGYNTRDTFLIVIPSMWIGVVTWTIWFDELYKFFERVGRGRTITLTLLIIFLPLLFYAGRKLIRRKNG